MAEFILLVVIAVEQAIMILYLWGIDRNTYRLRPERLAKDWFKPRDLSKKGV